MKNLNGKTAVVTGAASGIGRALALALAEEGARVAISDVNEEGLEETRQQATRRGAEIRAERLDVADREAVFGYADRVIEQFGSAHLVINNAGVTLASTVSESTVEDIEWLLGINFWGVIYGTMAFLPHFERAREGHIVNISSVFGLIGAPAQSAYNAAKFAVRGFTESLRQELDIEDNGVSCTCVHPGGIRTNIARAARVKDGGTFGATPDQWADDFENLLARTSPEKAARVILDGVKANKRRVLVGPDAYLIDRIQRNLPTGYQRILAGLTRRARDKWERQKTS